MQVRAHRHILQAADVLDVVPGDGAAVITVDTQAHQQRQEGIVMAEPQVRPLLAAVDPLLRLGHQVVHDGQVAQVRRPGVGVELEIVDPVQGNPFLRGEQVREYQVGIQAGHTGGEEVQIRDEIPLFLFRQGFVRVFEQAGQDGLVIDRPGDILRPGLVKGQRGLGHFRLTERIAAVQRKDGWQVILPEMLKDVQFRIRCLQSQAERRHGHHAARGSGGPGTHGGIVPEHFRIVRVHPGGQRFLLAESLARQVARTVVDGRIYPVETILVIHPERRQVLFVARFPKHAFKPRVDVALPGVAGAMAAIMADIEGFITLRRRRQVRRIRRT